MADPLAELQKLCDRFENRRVREYKIIKSTECRIKLKAISDQTVNDPIAARTRSHYRRPGSFEGIARVDNARIELYRSNRSLYSPEPPPAFGVTTGVKPFRPLYVAYANDIHNELDQMYRREEIRIQHADAYVGIRANGTWQCMRCAQQNLEEGRNSNINFHHVHVIGNTEALMIQKEIMKCTCKETVLTLDKITECDPCTDTYCRHDDDIIRKGIIFESEFAQVIGDDWRQKLLVQ
ncbi:hypothetical protein QAD02_002862 [Eretmocerus hayati]|uniref:Uncharacterized protein n=1 Tax=Eretmocerus hayati TaxID=131215 RepID=A0ACC2NK91_9HYME|nr:hypothetical protein QAD02_002862 [Eretmocerus hayati]